MTVRMGIDLDIPVPEGGEPSETEQGIADRVRWLNETGPYTSAYHEVMAGLALLLVRSQWRDAETYRRLEAQRAERLAWSAARKAAKGDG